MFVCYSAKKVALINVMSFKHLSTHISEVLNGSRFDITDGRKLEITRIEVVSSGMFVTRYFAD
jgi:hypothetical protein